MSNKITVSPQDMMTTIREQQAEITDLRLVLASARRQLVEAQAALAAAKKGDEGAAQVRPQELPEHEGSPEAA